MQLTKVQEQASNPKNSIWLSASAGTGKTHVLIIRFLRLLLEGNKISSILCLTYTKAAANEMKERVFKHLKNWSMLSKKELKQELLNLGEKDDENLEGKIKLAQTLFESSLNEMSYIKIQTIHAFCTNLLAQFPLEAEIPSNFSQSEASAKLLTQALVSVLEDKKTNTQVKSYAKDIDSIASFVNFSSNTKGNLASVLNQANLKDIFKNKELCQSVLHNLKTLLLIDGKKTLDDIKASYGNFLTSQELKEKLQQLKEHEESVTGSNLKKYLANVKLFLSKSDDDKKSSKTLLCKTLLTASKDEGLRISSTIITKKDTEKTGLAPLLQELANKLIDQEEALLKYSYYYNIHAKINLAFLVSQTYEELKQEKALLDYDDILYKTLALFKKSDDIMPWVFYKLDSFISHIMVDEAQDTNPIQWQIIKYLSSNFFVNASNNNTLFVVGDIKQSIYSFQGASPLYFNKMFNYFEDSFKKINKKLLFLSLNTSFRSSSAITSFTQFFCNKVFDKQIPYYEKEDFTHNCHKTDEKGFVQIWPLLKKLDKKDQETAGEQEEIEVVLARQIANKIQHLVRKEGVNPKDIIVLSDRRKEGSRPVYRHLRSFLAKRKIPYKASDRIKLSKSVFVQDMVALTSFLSQVYDSYSLAGVLKSPIFALSNQDIFDLQALNKQNSLWQNLQNNPKYQDVTAVLLALLKEVDVFSPYHIFSHLLYKQKVLNNYVSRLGQACVEDIEIFLDICLDFEEKSGSYSLDLFLEALEDYSQIDIKQEESEKSNQVIISTIHYFKGLEAKYVFLIDQINARDNKDSFYFVNKENESFVYAYDKNIIAKNKTLEDAFLENQAYEEDETKRKNYVAITRAINGLFVCNYTLSAKIDEVNTLNDITQEELLDFGFLKEIGSFAIKDGFVSDVLLTYKNNVEASKETPKQEDTQKEAIQEETKQNEETKDLDWVNLQITTQTEEKQEEQEEKANFTDDKATEIGTAVHDALDLIANLEKQEAIKMLENYLKTQELEDEDKQKVTTHVLNVIESDFYNNMLKHKIYTEASIAGVLGNKLSLNRVDAFYIEGNNIYIIDYKTSKNNESVSKVYKEQLLFYKQRFASVFEGYNIYCYLFFTSNANVIEVK